MIQLMGLSFIIAPILVLSVGIALVQQQQLFKAKAEIPACLAGQQKCVEVDGSVSVVQCDPQGSDWVLLKTCTKNQKCVLAENVASCVKN